MEAEEPRGPVGRHSSTLETSRGQGCARRTCGAGQVSAGWPDTLGKRDGATCGRARPGSRKCYGEWLSLGLAVDDTSGLVLTVDSLSAEDAETSKEWLAPVVEAVDAELLVSDDADAFKAVANDLGLEH